MVGLHSAAPRTHNRKAVKRLFFALCLLVFGTIAGTVESRAAPSPARGAGLWSTAASLIAGREAHTATLLPSGNVLVAGGTDGRGTALASAASSRVPGLSFDGGKHVAAASLRRSAVGWVRRVLTDG